MSASTQPVNQLVAEPLAADRWGWPSRLAFRFAFVYFGLYCLLTQILGGFLPIPGVDISQLGIAPPFRNVVLWTAKHVFAYKQTVVYDGSGSGDKVFDWVQMFCLLVCAAAFTGIWFLFDHRRHDDNKLYKWFRVFIRFALAGQLFSYGLVKLFPMQMPFPFLLRLLERYGDFSPMGVLWSSIGAAPAYERFAGGAELLAGLLLIVPATSMLGALISLMDVVEIFVLNMTYDVPVKLLSFHLLLMAGFLLIADRSRLVSFCLQDCPVQPSTAQKLFAGRRANRLAVVVQVLFGMLMLTGSLWGTWQGWRQYGADAPKSPLYGIWNIEEMVIDGTTRLPLLTDYDRWRRIIFDFPESMAFQRMDDSFGFLGANFDSKQSTLALTGNADPKWKGQMTVRRQNADRLTLEGRLGPHAMRMQLALMDRSKFLLVSRGFHWIQDYPFNR